MSLFGSMMADVEDDPIFGSHMRHMRQMNNMMNSLFSDPFGMFGGGGPLAIGPGGGLGAGHGGRHGGNSLMPFMPQMPSLNRLFAGDMDGHMGTGSFSSSMVVMSSGPNGKPQVYSATSSTKIGPNGIKETRKTLQDTTTGTKKMSIGHHIGERAHVVEREHNLYSGDAEERQEFINIEEEEAEDFDREFQVKAGMAHPRSNRTLPHSRGPHAGTHARRSPPQLALPAPPPAVTGVPAITSGSSESSRRPRPSSRRPLRTSASPLTTSSNHNGGVRSVYGSSHPQRRSRPLKHRRPSPPQELD